MDYNLAQINRYCHLIFEQRDRERQAARKQRRRMSKEHRPVQTRADHLPKESDSYIININAELTKNDITSCCYVFGPSYIQIDRALVHSRFAAGDYETVHFLIGIMSQYLPIGLSNELEELWDHSSYMLISTKFSRAVGELSPVHRYRIRKRNPCPIIVGRGPTRYKISKFARELMWSHFGVDPRPNKLVRMEISEKTGLNFETVTNWFKNRRQRAYDPVGLGCQAVETKSLPAIKTAQPQFEQVENPKELIESIIKGKPTNGENVVQEHYFCSQSNMEWSTDVLMEPYCHQGIEHDVFLGYRTDYYYPEQVNKMFEVVTVQEDPSNFPEFIY